jgi:multiple sugar transport system substrate-binding protein
MSQIPKKMDRRRFVYAGLGAVIVIVGGVAAYFATRPPEVIKETVEKTIVQTVSTTVERTITAPTTKPGKISIWWNLGYYAEEKLATVEAIKKFEEQTGIKVDISFIGTDELRDKLISAIKAGAEPDMTFTMWDIFLGPVWASKDLLLDVTDIIQENKDNYIEGMDKMAWWYNAKEKKWSYYGVPFHSNSNFIHVWTDLMEAAEKPVKDIPYDDWDSYWGYFKEIQDILEKKGITSKGQKIYGLGLCVGTVFDPVFASEEFFPAFDVNLVKEDGTIDTKDPKNKKGLADYLSWLQDLYTTGYIPPGATAWGDPDNNMAFHSKIVVLVMNNTMSIPGYQFGYSKENYYNKTATILKPNKGPKGHSWPTTARAESLLIFKSSKNIDLCKEFVRFMIKDENLLPWLKGSYGRYFPVFKSQMEDKFYHDPKDPHIPNAAQWFTKWGIRKWPVFVNPAYSGIIAETLHAKMIGRVLVDKWEPEKAAEEFLSRAESLVKAWSG